MQVLIMILVSVTLAEMMFTMGLKISFRGIRDAIEGKQWMIIRAVIANYLLIPAITMLMIILFRTEPAVAAGLIILAVSPAAPYALPFTSIAKGNLGVSVGLMVILAGSSAVIAPLLLHALLPVISAGNSSFEVDAVKLSATLLFLQLLPLIGGIALRQFKPDLADNLAEPASLLSRILNTLMIISVAWLQFKVISGIGTEIFLFITLIIITGLLCGWIMGRPLSEDKKAMAIITAMRNMSLSMTIAAGSFKDPQIVTTILIFSFVAGLEILIAAYILRKIPRLQISIFRRQ